VSCHDGSVAIGDIYWYNGAPRVLNSMHMPMMFQVGAGGDLTGQHPHAIPYPFNHARNTYNGSTTSASLDLTAYAADPTKNNMRLYSDLGGNTFTAAITPGKVGMECTTCHDPHNKATVDGCFLRGSLNSAASNYICSQCHLV
jgi:hypothetical protein